MEKPEDLFDRWYARPLELLEKMLPNGDGGFVALAVACALYERYATTVLGEAKIGDGQRNEQFAHDFGTDVDTADAFWKTIRNGILHKAMPNRDEKATEPRWDFRCDSPKAVELIEEKDKRVLRVHPWAFAHRVIELWRKESTRLAERHEAPWAQAYPVYRQISGTSTFAGWGTCSGDVFIDVSQQSGPWTP